jgi:GWxTD domain-containing protein
MFHLLTITITAATVLGAAPSQSEAERKLAAQQLFAQTQAKRDSLPLETYIERLARVTELDGKFAEAFQALGRAYIERETIDGRNLAQAALERAVQLAPRNLDYRYTLAQLYLRRGATGAAAGEFRAMIKINPTDARPYYQLALFKEEDMLRDRDRVNVYKDADVIISFHEFAEKDLAEAKKLLRLAVARDPKMAEARCRLAALYYEEQQYEEMAEVLEKGIAHRPTSDLFLFLGLARQQLGRIGGAMAAYEQALQMMPAADRELFYSLQTVLAPDSLAAYESAPDSLKPQFRERYWKARDPLLLTTVNERMLEHFGRVAYANLRFSLPGKKIVGWKTDRGKTLIRFGNHRTSLRMGTYFDSLTTYHNSIADYQLRFNPSVEVWNYGDFSIRFADPNMNGNFVFAWGNFASDGRWAFEHQIRKEPERYIFPHGGRRLELPHIIAQFQDTNSDSTLLEVYFGVPELPEQKAERLKLWRGLFFFDANWNEIRQWQEYQTLVNPMMESNTSTGVAHTTTETNYLIDRWPVTMRPGAYHFALEVLNPKSGHSGSEREPIIVEDFSGDRLCLSSVVLANAAATGMRKEKGVSLSLYKKDEVDLVPSLFQKFSADTVIYVYYEIYHLVLAENGRSRCRVDYTVESVQESKSLVSRTAAAFGRFIGLGDRRGAITSSFESSGDSRTEKLYHGFELLDRQIGQYDLTIRVTDQLSGQAASRSVRFAIK